MASAEERQESTASGDSGTADASQPAAEGVGPIAELYLGNILYALERCAMSFDAEQSPEHASFYRGIARKLATAHGRASKKG